MLLSFCRHEKLAKHFGDCSMYGDAYNIGPLDTAMDILHITMQEHTIQRLCQETEYGFS